MYFPIYYIYTIVCEKIKGKRLCIWHMDLSTREGIYTNLWYLMIIIQRTVVEVTIAVWGYFIYFLPFMKKIHVITTNQHTNTLKNVLKMC